MNLYGIEILFLLKNEQLMIVWIEPLWNWNSGITQGKAHHWSLNWTFMELKFISYANILKITVSLNWTFMELKWNKAQQLPNHGRVWIEPLWNWNTACRWARMGILLFELNLYGIEITMREIQLPTSKVWIEPLWNWNHVVRL